MRLHQVALSKFLHPSPLVQNTVELGAPNMCSPVNFTCPLTLSFCYLCEMSTMLLVMVHDCLRLDTFSVAIHSVVTFEPHIHTHCRPSDS